MAKARKNKTEEQREAGREAKLDRLMARISEDIAPADFEYTVSAQAKALRHIERRIYGA